MVPAPIERSEVRGHDNRSENLQHLQRRRLLSIVQCRSGCGTELSSEFGSVNPSRCPHARAWRELIPASSAADRPARAAWLALRLLVDVGISFLRNCWLADSGLGPTMEFRRSLLTSASPGRTAMVPAPIERSEVRGHDNRSEIPQL